MAKESAKAQRKSVTTVNQKENLNHASFPRMRSQRVPNKMSCFPSLQKPTKTWKKRKTVYYRMKASLEVTLRTNAIYFVYI